MSDFIKEISKLGDADDDAQEAGNGGDGGVQVEQSGGVGYGGFIKAKKVALFPIAKAKKQFFHRRNKQQEEQNKRVSSPAAANVGANTKGCYFCFKQPFTLESSAESFTSDPNDSSFTYEMLSSFIEKNDFYSKDCNPHLE